MAQIRKFFESPPPRNGQPSPVAEIFSGRDELTRQGRLFADVRGVRVRSVITDHGGDRASCLLVEGEKKAGERRGAQTGGHEGNDFWIGRHPFRMDGLG